MRSFIAACLITLVGSAWVVARQPRPGQSIAPGAEFSEDDPYTLKFAAVGGSGTGGHGQYAIARQMDDARWWLPFELVLMLGDNVDDHEQPRDFIDKFDRPYAPLLQCFVRFHAVLGDQDDPGDRFDRRLNMNGERYYTFVRKNVRFIALDSTRMDPQQLAWLRRTASEAEETWKVAYFHHPLHADPGLRAILEPVFVETGITIVLSGHRAVYQRLTHPNGITYFVEGASGQVRPDDTIRSPWTVASFNREESFVLIEIDGDKLVFRALSRTGEAVDSGVIIRGPTS